MSQPCCGVLTFLGVIGPRWRPWREGSCRRQGRERHEGTAWTSWSPGNAWTFCKSQRSSHHNRMCKERCVRDDAEWEIRRFNHTEMQCFHFQGPPGDSGPAGANGPAGPRVSKQPSLTNTHSNHKLLTTHTQMTHSTTCGRFHAVVSSLGTCWTPRTPRQGR